MLALVQVLVLVIGRVKTAHIMVRCFRLKRSVSVMDSEEEEEEGACRCRVSSRRRN